MKRITRRPWTEEEEEYVRTNAHRFTSEYMGLRLNRTGGAVRSKAQELGVKLSHWPDEDLQFLRENAWRMTAKQIAAARGKDESQVVSKAKYEGIRFGPKRRNFTAQQG